MSVESVLVELSGSVSRIRQDFDEHKIDDRKNFKYAHHMLENLLGKHSELTLTNAKEQTEVQKTLASIVEKLKWIERLTWVVLLGVISFTGSQILKAVG